MAPFLQKNGAKNLASKNLETLGTFASEASYKICDFAKTRKKFAPKPRRQGAKSEHKNFEKIFGKICDFALFTTTQSALKKAPARAQGKSEICHNLTAVSRFSTKSKAKSLILPYFAQK